MYLRNCDIWQTKLNLNFSKIGHYFTALYMHVHVVLHPTYINNNYLFGDDW